MTRVSLMAACILFSLSACEDEDTGSENEEVLSEQAISDDALADDLFEDMDEISMEAATYDENTRMQGGILSRLTCLSRTVERENMSNLSKRITLTFSEGCVDAKGRIRSGSMIIEHSIDLTAATYTVSTTFEDFYVNGHQIEGTRTIVYSSDEENIISASISLTDGKILLADGSTISRNGSFTKLINRGTGEISLNGKASGINRNGISYISEITSPLVYKMACTTDGIFMAASGKKTISRVGRKTLTLDYGDGTCDRSLTLNAEGVERTLEITVTK